MKLKFDWPSLRKKFHGLVPGREMFAMAIIQPENESHQKITWPYQGDKKWKILKYPENRSVA